MHTSYLILQQNSRYFAFPQFQVREVLARPALANLPGLPKLIAGFVNLEGLAYPVIDLALVLGLPELKPDRDQHLIVFRQANSACLVERVLDFCVLDRVVDLPSDHVFNAWGKGVLTYQGQQTILLDAQALLLSEEKQRLSYFQDQAQARLSEWGVTNEV